MSNNPVDFDDLVRREAAGIHATAWRVLRDEAAARDVTQQVFVRVLRDPAWLPDDGEARRGRLRWLAARFACNELRAVRRRRRREAEHAHRRTMDDASIDPAAADERRVVAHALGALPDAQRVPLVLRYHEGLTLADVAGVLGCAESTAHARIRRGLDALRGRLEQLGFGAAATRLVVVLPETGASVAIPAGLQAQLLALPAVVVPAAGAAATLGVTAKLALVGAVLASAAVAVGTWAPWRAPRPREEVAAGPAVAVEDDAAAAVGGTAMPGPGASVRRAVVGPPADAAGSAVLPMRPATASVRGLVRDGATGMPVADARVAVRSLRLQGKMALHHEHGVSGGDGRFEITVPVNDPEDPARRTLRFLASVEADAFRSLRSEPFEAEAGAVVDLGVLRLARVLEDRAAPWRATAEVVGPDGTPVEGAIVAMYRRGGPEAPELRRHETGGKTGPDGRIELLGDHHGDKLLWVRPGGSSLAPLRIELAITSSTPEPIRVELREGATIRGSVTAVATGEPVAGMWLGAVAADDPDHAMQARTDEQGRFAFLGLAPGSFTVESQPTAAGWSAFRIDDVAAGEQDLRVLAKRFDDDVPRGHFVGEVRGRVVDAASGAPRPLLWHQLDSIWIDPDDRDWQARVVRSLFRPIPVQRMAAQQEAVQIDGGRITMRRERPTATFSRSFGRDGRYVLVVSDADGGAGFAGPFDVRPGVMHRDVVIELASRVPVVGQVVDAVGAPVAGARVWLGTVGEVAANERRDLRERWVQDGALPFGPRTTTDASGRFELEGGLPGFDLRVHAIHPAAGHGASERLVLRAGEERRATRVALQR